MRRAGSASPEAISADAHALARLRHRLVREADHIECGQPGRDLHLHVDRAGLDALERYRGDPLDHRPCPYRLCKSVAESGTR